MTTLNDLQANLNGLTARLFDENNNAKDDRDLLLKGLKSIRERINAALDDLESGIVGSFNARDNAISVAIGTMTQEMADAPNEVLPFKSKAAE